MDHWLKIFKDEIYVLNHENLINDQEKRNEMGIAGRKFVEDNFTWEKIAEKFLKDVKEVIKK